MAIFMKYGDEKGEVTYEGYKDWIEINSFQWGVGRGISSGGGGSKRESSAPSISEITVSSTMSAFSPLALKEALTGEGVLVKIDITRTNSTGGHQPFQQYELSETMVSGYSVSSGGDNPSESLSLNFQKVQSLYLKVDETLGMVATGAIIYNLETAKLG